jgi:hypothetical protein
MLMAGFVKPEWLCERNADQLICITLEAKPANLLEFDAKMKETTENCTENKQFLC